MKLLHHLDRADRSNITGPGAKEALIRCCYYQRPKSFIALILQCSEMLSAKVFVPD